MTNYKVARRDKYGNEIPVHFKSSTEKILDRINKGVKTLDKKCEEYVNGSKADEHVEIAKRIGENITRAAGNSLLTAIKDGISLVEACVVTTGGIIARDTDTVKMGGKIAYTTGKERAKRIANGIKSLTQTGSFYYVNWDKLSNESKKRLYEYGITTVLGVFLTAAMWHEIGLSSTEVQDITLLYPNFDIDNLPYVDDGVFIGNNDDLQDLIKLGEMGGTVHYSDIDRNIAAVNEFLNKHDISEHDGYEVHHIIPLSEGGADVPENMVLIRSDLHHQITAAHNAFYGWHN